MPLPTDDLDPEEPRGDLVTWMAPGPLQLGAAGVITAIVGAFALGIIAAVGLLAATRGPTRTQRPTVH